MIEHGDDCDYIIFEGNRRPVMMINNQAGREGKNFKMKGRLSEQRNTYDPAKRLADMDLDGIDQAILFGGGPLGTFDNDLYIASFEAYSRWVMDWASNAPHRLFPVGHAPMRDIDETIEHVQRLAKMGFKMVQLPAFPQNPEAWKTSSEIKNMKSGQVSAQTGDPKGALQYYQPEFDRLWKVLCRPRHGHHLPPRRPRAALRREAALPARHADEQAGDGRADRHLHLQRHLRPLPRPAHRQHGIGRGLVRLVSPNTSTAPGRSSATGPKA